MRTYNPGSASGHGAGPEKETPLTARPYRPSLPFALLAVLALFLGGLAGCQRPAPADGGPTSASSAAPSPGQPAPADASAALPAECLALEQAQRDCTEAMAAGYERAGQPQAAKALRDGIPAALQDLRRQWESAPDRAGLAASCAAARDAVRAQPQCKP